MEQKSKKNRIAKVGKKLREVRNKIDKFRLYAVVDAVKVLKDLSFTKFDQTLEVVFKLGVDPRHSDQMVRGMVSLPAGTGKVAKVAVFCKDERVAEALAAGADIAGSIDIISDIKSGNINFDVCIATPDMMASLGQIAKILGPKGLMPNPKLGTVTVDIATAIQNAKTGQVEFRVEKAGIVHAGIGKLSFVDDDLMSNVRAIFNAIIAAKPSGAKGTYVKSVFLSSTMGPALRVDLASVL